MTRYPSDMEAIVLGHKLEICLLTAVLVTQGCSTGSPAGAVDGGAQQSDGQSSENDAQGADPAAKIGTFTVRLHAPTPATAQSPAVAGFTSIIGKVFDGEVPSESLLDLDREEGGCRLLKPRAPFCDPPCTGGVCVEDGQCQRSPSARSVGRVTLSGVRTVRSGRDLPGGLDLRMKQAAAFSLS